MPMPETKVPKIWGRRGAPLYEDFAALCGSWRYAASQAQSIGEGVRFESKADIRSANTNVRCGPKADIQSPCELSLEIASSVMDSVGGPAGPSIVFDGTRY